MSQAEELLDNLTKEEITLYTMDLITERHIIVGNDRIISVPDSLKRIAVQYDHNVETVTFDCPRYWDGIDMSKMKIYINYKLPDDTLGAYIANNIVVDDSDKNVMHFDWTIMNDVTQIKGTLSFLVCIKKTGSDGIEENHWNSELNTEMYISGGLACGESILNQHPAIITDLLTRMDKIITANTPILDKTLTEMGLAADAMVVGTKLAAEENARIEADAIEKSERQAEIAVERNRIDNFTSLQQGSTTGDAELMDIRVGFNGKIHNNAGDAVREQVTGLKNELDDIKTSFFTKSDIEYEIVKGKKISGFNSFLSGDDAFTLFIKIPDKNFAWISVTPSNTVVPYGSGTRLSGSLICDADKKALGAYGHTDNNRNLCVLRGNKVSEHDGAVYFATSYTLGTEFDIKIGGIDTHNDSEIPITSTEISNDFFVSGKNLIHDLCNVQYAPSNSWWTYTGTKITNFFEVSNGKIYYHNSNYIYLDLFDENYNYVNVASNFASGTALNIADNVKYAYARSTVKGNINDSFWFADTDLSRDTYTPNKLINPKYIDLNINRKQINNWYNGKRVSFMGDSLTDSGSGGFYINYLNDYFGFANIKKSAIAGTRVSGVTTVMGDPFWYDSRVNQLDIDSDVVFIMGGTNDANNNVTLGSPDISNCDTNTFYGAYHVLISKLIYKYYKLDTGYYADIDYSGVTQVDTARPIQIFLITPPYMLNTKNAYNAIFTFADAVIEIGKLLGCPVCDTRANSGVNMFTREYYKYVANPNTSPTPSYIHISPEAHKQWTKVIIGKMLETEPIGSEEQK